MTSEEMQALLSKPNNAIIGINRANGGPQLTPVWFAWDGKSFFFSTTKDRTKYLNLKRNPSITLIVDDLESHENDRLEQHLCRPAFSRTRDFCKSFVIPCATLVPLM